MSFVNASPYVALDVPSWDARGRRVVVAIVKATYELDRQGRLVPGAEPSPVRVADERWDPERPHGSVRYPSDVCVEKRGADVVVVGSATSRRPVQRMDVLVRVGRGQDRERGVRGSTVEAPLVVHGERAFVWSARGVVVGPAAPFLVQPVVYERAYGGMAADLALVEEQNPAGVGVAPRAADLVGAPAPQIEHPGRPHLRASDAFPPAGYGATRSHWLPRRGFAGTFDDAWREHRMPLLPLDFDARFDNVAHPSLQLPEPLRAGAPVAILGMSEAGVLQCELPDLHLVVHGLRDREKVTVRPQVDTLLIEPDRGRLELVARVAFSVGRGASSLREIRIDTDA